MFKVIPIASGQITGTLTDFPVMVKPSALTGWGSLTLTEAQSSRWYADEAKTTELPREIVSADEIHVLVPSAANGTNIYCEYDDIASDYAATDTYGRNAVWADYLHVYHMSAVTDATGSGVNLVATGAPALTTGAFGVANSAYDYPGNTSNYHKTGSDVIPNADTNDWTIQAWANPDVSTRGDFLGVWPELQIKWDHATYADDYSFWSLYASTNVSAATTSNYSLDVWRMVHGTLDYSTLVGEIFVNGAPIATSTGSGSRVAGDYPLAIGAEWAGAVYNPFNGGVDEVRLRQGILTDDWIAAEYNNQGAVATFFGTVSEVGADTTPTVTTQAVSSIASTTATGNGNVTDDGGATITERGVCWNTSGTPTTSDSTATSAGTTGAFTASMTGLSAGTLYYVRAYAINAEGTSYGSEVTFTTDTTPTVTTQAVSSIGETTATGNGNVTADGGDTITERGVCWSTTSSPDTSDSTATSAGTTGAFTANMTGLTGSTLYYVRAYAINSLGTSYGSEVSFTTAAGDTAPTVTTQAVSSITATTATGNGNVTADGGDTVTERGVCWATTSSPDTSDSTATSAGTTGAFTANITGLTSNTLYYVRAYAINSIGTSYGDEVSFTTDTTPTVTTQAVSSITHVTAVGNGNVTDDGGDTITERGVCWKTTTGPTTSDSTATSAGTTGAFTASMTGLTAETTYYVKAYATNSLGTVYGSEVSFTTTAAPVITTRHPLKMWNGTDWIRVG